MGLLFVKIGRDRVREDRLANRRDD